MTGDLFCSIPHTSFFPHNKERYLREMGYTLGRRDLCRFRGEVPNAVSPNVLTFFLFRMGTAAEYLSRTRIGAYFHETRGSRKLVRATKVYQTCSKLIDC